jgi:endonuclease-3 related protein
MPNVHSNPNLRHLVVSSSSTIRRLYRILAEAYGPLHWWPARTRFEVIVGAFLTQNTSWKNVERALQHLRQARILNIAGIRRTSLNDLELLIRPSGYFHQKAARLKTFISYLDERHGGSLSRMFSQPLDRLRPELLELNGVGPETADAILLYAGKLPVFVVDAYAKRIFERHGITAPNPKYQQVRSLVETDFQSSYSNSELADHYNEFHALIVEAGKRHCGTAARCAGCPLESLLPKSQHPERSRTQR